MATPNLAIAHIAAAQNQKEVTANAGLDALDVALTNNVVEVLTDHSFSIPAVDALGNMVFLFTGTLTQSRGVTLPSTRKLYIVQNQTSGSGSPVATGFPLTFGTASSPTGRTAIVYPGVSVYTILYCDGLNVDVVSVATYDVSVFAPGVGTNAQILLRIPVARNVFFPSGAVNAFASASAIGTGGSVFSIKKNGTQFATVTFPLGSAAGIFTQTQDAFLFPNDVLEIDGPAIADATLANVGIALQGFRF